MHNEFRGKWAALLALLAACATSTPPVAPVATTAAPPSTTAAPRTTTTTTATPSSRTTVRRTTTTVRPSTTTTVLQPVRTAHGLQGAVIAVDPGHNGANGSHPDEINRQVDAGGFQKACDTTGTQTASGYTEAAYTFDVATRLAAVLRAAGATAVLTRSTNSGDG